MPERLTLADGTVIDKAYILETVSGISFYVRGEVTMGEVFALMNDPEKTAVIKAQQNGEEATFTGYTDLWSIQKTNRQISGGLRRGN